MLAELPITRETLALRLLGRGPTLVQALLALRALRDDAWEHRLVDVLLRWRREEHPTPTTTEEETIMGALAELRAWRAQQDAQLREAGLLEGRMEGRHEGQLAVLDRQLAHKLRRSLTEAERDTLRARLADQGEHLAEAVVDLDAPALEARSPRPTRRDAPRPRGRPRCRRTPTATAGSSPGRAPRRCGGG